VNAPHSYVPDGPVETIPDPGYCLPATRLEAFAAVLQGVPLGAYDRRMVGWLVGWDDSTCRTIASIMWRCRLAGSALLAPADHALVLAALEDAAAARRERTDGSCYDCATDSTGRCEQHRADLQTAAAYSSLHARLAGA
jgi:hypothetical protein